MKIALISDIHGNMPALNAVLADAKSINVEEYLFIGDYLTDGPYTNEIIDKVKDYSEYVICGNREKYLINYNPNDKAYKQTMPIIWTYNNLSKESLEYIKSLKDNICYEFDGVKINMLHIPEFNNIDKNGITSIPDIDKIFYNTNSDIEVFGHTHKPLYYKREKKYIINPGSVGLPLHGNPNVQYCIIEIINTIIEVYFRECSYDVKKYQQAFLDKGKKDDCNYWSIAVMTTCQTGHNYCLDFLLYAKDYSKQILGKETPLVPDEIWEIAGKNFKFPRLLI